MNNLFELVHLMLVARQGHMTRTNSIEVAHEAISLCGWPSLQQGHHFCNISCADRMRSGDVEHM
jgi:hypothetical protein